jgi:enoyl-CoA hydratase
MSETVSMSIRDRVAVVTIERPQHRNAVDLPTSKDLLSAFKSFDVNDEVDVAILTGAGGSFCSGADLKALAAGERKPVNPDGEFAPMGPTRLRLQKPVIAAIEGPAVAGGMELALWCDLRIVARSAVLGIFNRRFGVPLVDLGTIRLPRLIGQGRALELILTGRPVEAQEALAIGLVNAVVDDGTALENALIWAKKISAFPQNALRNDRMSVMEQWDLDEVSAIANEIKHGLATIQSGETLSGSNRFSDGVGRHGKFT